MKQQLAARLKAAVIEAALKWFDFYRQAWARPGYMCMAYAVSTLRGCEDVGIDSARLQAGGVTWRFGVAADAFWEYEYPLPAGLVGIPHCWVAIGGDVVDLCVRDLDVPFANWPKQWESRPPLIWANRAERKRRGWCYRPHPRAIAEVAALVNGGGAERRAVWEMTKHYA